MKLNEKNSEEYSKLNNKQLAVKIICNSFYGVLGASFGMLSAKKLAMCITARGRYLLNYAKDTFFKVCPYNSCWKVDNKSYNLKGVLVYGKYKS
jgi:DNA polymerase elongation subunit (family B)